METRQILAVEDEPHMCEILEETLEALPNVKVSCKTTGQHAMNYLHNHSCDLLLTDLCLPDVSGTELLRLARSQNVDIPMLVLTAYPTVESAIEAMKLGANDYLTKPFVPDVLLHKVEQLLLYTADSAKIHNFAGIIGQSPRMQHLFRVIRRVSHSNMDLLIHGETGTGKELVARAIHQHSQRSDGPFVPIDCGAIPESLMESELFGYERGAFTGAGERRTGLLEYSDQGTFFLDEIGELPLLMQAKLLRVLQERKLRRLGGRKEIPFSTRVIAATRRDLAQEVKAGRFREDLYFRLNTLSVELPPLRERGLDIHLLADHFLAQYGHEYPVPLQGFTDQVRRAFERYSWPGNVRELQNAVRRAIALTDKPFINVSALPPTIAASASSGDFPAFSMPGLFKSDLGTDFHRMRDEHIQQFERAYLHHMLQHCQGQIPLIVELSGLSRSTLYRLISKYEIELESYRTFH